LKVNENILEDNNTNNGRRSTSTNVVFKTSIINNNNIKFNTIIGSYTEWSFMIDAIHNARKNDYYYKFPIYYSYENHDSLNILKYAENDFDDEFKAYVKNFIRYIYKAHNDRIRQFMINDLKDKLETEFDPHHPQVAERYKNNKDSLEIVAKFLNKNL